MRVRTVRNLYDKKDKTYPLDGLWGDTMGHPETNGAWLIYGAEKNGKTWLALMLSKYMSQFERTLYVSAEEGLGVNFIASCQRAGIDKKDKKLQFTEEIPLSELSEKLKKQRAHKIVVLDNITIYNDELKNGGLRNLLSEHPRTLFILLAHEERNEPYTATAKLCRRLAKIIIRVQGLACDISGRCPGGRLMIDEEKAQLYHGTEINQ